MTSTDRLAEMAAEIERLRQRVTELESHAAITFGTLAPPTEDGPTRYTHNIPPSAPPHDERRTVGGEELTFDVPPNLPPGRFVRIGGDPNNDE